MVYFIQQGDTGPVKIGYTRENPQKRLDSLQTGNPYPLKIRLILTGGRRLEKTLHRKFSHARMRGEWFENTEEMRAFMKAAAAKQRSVEGHLEGAILHFANQYGEEERYG